MKLEPDGERMVVEHYHGSASDYLIYQFHLVSYRFAYDIVCGGDVLDLGCGSGYGSALLAEGAKSVVGVDVSAAAIDYARDRHSRSNIAYRQISPDAPLPFENASFDSVVCFQVIEHVRNDCWFVSEIARVLKPGGIAIIATPDRSTRLLPGQKPWNRWHVKEYSAGGLSRVLKTSFDEVSMQFMSGTSGVIDIEIRRSTRLKWLTLPFTVPIIPEWLRFLGLSSLRRLQDAARPQRLKQKEDFGFTSDDLWIGRSPSKSVNLIALARQIDR